LLVSSNKRKEKENKYIYDFKNIKRDISPQQDNILEVLAPNFFL